MPVSETPSAPREKSATHSVVQRLGVPAEAAFDSVTGVDSVALCHSLVKTVKQMSLDYLI